MADRTYAPWTDEETERLNGYQLSGIFHPFTCPNRSDGSHRYHNGDLGGLRATKNGWVCNFCDYTQDWAYPFMVDGWQDMVKQFVRAFKHRRPNA